MSAYETYMGLVKQSANRIEKYILGPGRDNGFAFNNRLNPAGGMLGAVYSMQNATPGALPDLKRGFRQYMRDTQAKERLSLTTRHLGTSAKHPEGIENVGSAVMDGEAPEAHMRQALQGSRSRIDDLLADSEAKHEAERQANKAIFDKVQRLKLNELYDNHTAIHPTMGKQGAVAIGLLTKKQ